MQYLAATGERRLETAGLNPACIPTSSLKRGGGRPPPRDPLRGMQYLAGEWRVAPGDGRIKSGLHPHLVFKARGRQASPAGPPPRDAISGGDWRVAPGDGRIKSGLNPNSA